MDFLTSFANSRLDARMANGRYAKAIQDASDIELDVDYILKKDVMPTNTAQELDESELIDMSSPTGSNWAAASQRIYETFRGDRDLKGRNMARGAREPQTPEEYAQWGIEFIGQMNHNFTSMAVNTVKLNGQDDMTKLAMHHLFQDYERLPGMSWNGTKRFFKGIATDPTTYVGLGTLGFGTLGVAGAKQMSKQGFSRLLRGSLNPKMLAAYEGAGYTGAFDAMRQNVDVQAGIQDERDLGQTGLATVLGGLGGRVLAEGVDQVVKNAPAIAGAVREGIDQLGQAADARTLQRAQDTSVQLNTGVDPMQAIDAALSGAGKVARGMQRQVVTPGTTIPPTTSPPTTDDLAAAQADTRQTAESVGQRLDITVPEAERVAGGTYVAGAPGGGRWSDLPEETLNQRGPGFAGSDADLARMWQETLSEVSQAARDSVSRTGATWQAFPAKSWDLAMRLPNRHQFWYELSGESFVDRLPELNMDEHMMFVDLVGATSARAGPGPNLERAVAVLSQNLRGVPVDVDLTTQSTVEAALQRQGVGVSSDLANKTGMFSDTLALTGGLPVRYPIAVNDVWVAKAYGITDGQLGSNQALHEVFGKYTNKLRDFTNQKSPGGIPHQSWQKQARQWVQMRSADDGIDTSQVTSVEGNDYASEFGRLVEKLEGAGINVPGGVLTRNILMDPRVADALRTTTPGYREAPKATVEFGTLLTPSGEKAASIFAAARDAGDTLTQQEYLGTLTGSMYNSARGKTLWEKTVRLATNESRMVTRISAPTKADPFAYSGTFEGAAAPNIRIPLKNMSPDQIAYFNAMAGKGLKQKAMAAAEIKNIDLNEALPEGYIETSTLYFPWNQRVPEELIIGVSRALGEGFEVSASKTPGGLKIDINPRFTDDGAEGPGADAIDSATDFLENEFGAQNVEEFRAAYKSDYGKNYVEDDGTGATYDEIIEATLKGWEDEAAQEIQSIAGTSATADAITAYLRGDTEGLVITGDGLTSAEKASIKRKTSTVLKRVRARVDSHNQTLAEWGQLGNELDNKMTTAIPKWERRAAARAKNQEAVANASEL